MWAVPDLHADIPTRVFVEFIDHGEQTEVVLTHDKLPKEACERHIAVWESIFNRLAPYLSVTEARYMPMVSGLAAQPLFMLKDNYETL